MSALRPVATEAYATKYLFSGLTKCAECGGGCVMYWRDRLSCFGGAVAWHVHQSPEISRQEVEERVLVALRDKLMRRDLFEDFCREYVRELNRLRMEHRASLSHGRQELASVEREIRKLGVGICIGRLKRRLRDMYSGILQHLSHVRAPLVVTITNQHAMGAQQAVHRGQRASHLSHEQPVWMRCGPDELDAP